MNRRNFLAGIAPLAMQPALAAQGVARLAGRMKITGIPVVRLKLIKEVGTLDPAWNPCGKLNFVSAAARSPRSTLTTA